MHREGRLDWKVDPKYDRIRVEAIAVPKLKVLWLASYKKRIPVVLFSNAVGRYHSQPSPERRNHLQSKGEWSWQKFPSLLPKVLRRLTTTESFNKVRRVDLMLSRRDLCSLQEQKRFFRQKKSFFFVFSIPGVPHTYGNCQSKVSQFSSQTPHCWSKRQSLRGNKQRKGRFIKQSISLKVKFCSYRRWKYQGMSYWPTQAYVFFTQTGKKRFMYGYFSNDIKMRIINCK